MLGEGLSFGSGQLTLRNHAYLILKQDWRPSVRPSWNAEVRSRASPCAIFAVVRFRGPSRVIGCQEESDGGFTAVAQSAGRGFGCAAGI